MHFSTDWLTYLPTYLFSYLLMPSDKHNSRTARARDLISSLINLAYYVMKQVRHCWNWGVMAFTYRDMGCVFHEHILRIFHNGWMDCRDAFHAVLCLYCCIMDKTYVAEYEVYWPMGFPVIKLWGTHFTNIFSLFYIMAGWILTYCLPAAKTVLLKTATNLRQNLALPSYT